MKTRTLKTTLLVLLLIPTLGSAENLFRNSAMDTAATWAGDRNFETVEGNRVMSLKAKKNKSVMFYQEAETRDQKDLVIKFRYQTADYKGRGLQIRGTRQNGSSTFRTIALKTDGQWVEYKWEFSELRGSGQIRFSFELMDGTGTVRSGTIRLHGRYRQTPGAAEGRLREAHQDRADLATHPGGA